MYLSILIPASSLTDYLCIFTEAFQAEVSSKRLERSSGTTETKRELLWITAFKWICAWKHWPREIDINPFLHWNHFGVLTLFQFLPQNNVISGARNAPGESNKGLSHFSPHQNHMGGFLYCEDSLPHPTPRFRVNRSSRSNRAENLLF